MLISKEEKSLLIVVLVQANSWISTEKHGCAPGQDERILNWGHVDLPYGEP